MTLRERLKRMFDNTKEEEQEYERRKIEPLKPIYSDKPSDMSALASSLNSSSAPPSFENAPVSLESWKEKASKELPDSEYYLENFSPAQLKELVIANRRGHDISVFADPDQTPEQLRFIYTHAEFGEDISEYIHNTKFDPVRIEKRESAAFELDVMSMNQERKQKKEEKYVSSLSSVLENAYQRSEATLGSGGKVKDFDRVMG